MDKINSKDQKYCFWFNIPDHHQIDFIREMKNQKIDIQVRFYEKLTEYRKNMGWDPSILLNDNEKYVNQNINSLYVEPDWRQRIHIVPGVIGNKFLMNLVNILIKNRVLWVHWSECVKPGINRLLRIPFRRVYGLKINKFALGALAVSKQAEIEFIRWGINPQKIRWLPYTMNVLSNNLEEDPIIKNFCRNKFIFIYCGALCKRKGTDILIKAFAKLIKKYIDIGLVLVGPIMNNKYKNIINRDLLENSILLRGPISANTVANAMHPCDVFILPSRYDGWGMVLNEAISTGLPIIASNGCGASYHIILNGINGFTVRANNVNELINNMEKYILNRNLAKKHGENSIQISKYFTPQNNVIRFIDIMNEFLYNTLK
jgi:glycosyltransferase involved in cell wall biosynthesis